MAAKRKNVCPCCGRETEWRERPGGRRLEVVKGGVSFNPVEGGKSLLLTASGDFVTGVIRVDGKEWGSVPHFMVCDRARRAMDANRQPARRAKRTAPRPKPQDPQLSIDDIYAGYTRADDIAF